MITSPHPPIFSPASSAAIVSSSTSVGGTPSMSSPFLMASIPSTLSERIPNREYARGHSLQPFSQRGDDLLTLVFCSRTPDQSRRANVVPPEATLHATQHIRPSPVRSFFPRTEIRSLAQ